MTLIQQTKLKIYTDSIAHLVQENGKLIGLLDSVAASPSFNEEPQHVKSQINNNLELLQDKLMLVAEIVNSNLLTEKSTQLLQTIANANGIASIENDLYAATK